MVKRRSSKDGEITAAVPGRNIYRLVAVSFGLLCTVQAVLNVSLRLALYRNTLNIEAHFKNLTKERDELKRKLMGFENIEARFKNITEERDELKTLIDFGLHSFKWINFSGSLYYISSCVASWNESRADCLQKGADLAIINNHEEQEFTRRFEKYAWIGLTHINTKWKWVDGTPLTTSYWGKSEPNNATGHEDCAEINNYYEENSWNDASCNLQRFWICEKLLPK